MEEHNNKMNLGIFVQMVKNDYNVIIHTCNFTLGKLINEFIIQDVTISLSVFDIKPGLEMEQNNIKEIIISPTNNPTIIKTEGNKIVVSREEGNPQIHYNDTYENIYNIFKNELQKYTNAEIPQDISIIKIFDELINRYRKFCDKNGSVIVKYNNRYSLIAKEKITKDSGKEYVIIDWNEIKKNRQIALVIYNRIVNDYFDNKLYSYYDLQ
jgi:sporulation protein YlmC with PRC-barrel domain